MKLVCLKKFQIGLVKNNIDDDMVNFIENRGSNNMSVDDDTVSFIGNRSSNNIPLGDTSSSSSNGSSSNTRTPGFVY